MSFPSHDLDSAPEGSKPLLENSQKAFGRLPGLHKVLAESPQAFEGYQLLHKLFTETDFDADELTVVWQAINVEHECHYCVPAHTGIAKMMKVSDEISDALRNETPLQNAKLEALRTFTIQMVRTRGNVSETQMAAFLDAGYDHRAVLDVLALGFLPGGSRRLLGVFRYKHAPTGIKGIWVCGTCRRSPPDP